MKLVSRAFVALLAAGLVGCNPQIPPAGNYATVFGQVVDAATQAPIAGAVVTINSAQSATTDAGGNFKVINVPTGPWSYSVQAPNYRPAVYDGPPTLAPGEKRNFPISLTHQ
jgi:uncharacterized membrane protein